MSNIYNLELSSKRLCSLSQLREPSLDSALPTSIAGTAGRALHAPFPAALTSPPATAESSAEKVRLGQGEYVVFHAGMQPRSPARETFEKAYHHLIENDPKVIASGTEDSDLVQQRCRDRYTTIQRSVQKIAPDLNVAFIPRTLYELIFIRKYIEQDLASKEACTYVSNGVMPGGACFGKPEKHLAERVGGICWHLPCFLNMGDNQHFAVIELAYRLNTWIVNTYMPTPGGFTIQDLQSLTAQQIGFLQNLYQNEDTAREITKKQINSGPTNHFSTDARSCSMKIASDKDVQVITDALNLDCSVITKRACIIYRGALYSQDSIMTERGEPYSLSYGTGIFAGCVYDPEATPYTYMKRELSAYALVVPFDQLLQSPFFVPPTHTIAQLLGGGELFHGRTKIWRDWRSDEIEGIGKLYDPKTGEEIPLDLPPYLRSNLPKDKLNAVFRHFKRNAIFLAQPRKLGPEGQ
jgi:hypothetical protein